MSAGVMVQQVSKALNGDMERWVRTFLTLVMVGLLAWGGISIVEIKSNRFTAQDGLEMQRQLTQILQTLEKKVDRSDAPPADYRRYVDNQFQQLTAEVNELHKVIERLESKIDSLSRQ